MSDASQNPYVGPRTFTRKEGRRFFGRESEAHDLLARVISERLVLFYAQSGAGKSSLLNTRLIPQLQASGFGVLPVGRVSGTLPPEINAVDNIFVFNLLLSLDQSGGDPQYFSSMTLGHFLARLTSPDGEHYYHQAEHETETGDYESAPSVLIIDQFEEIITTHLEYWPQRADFFRQLDQAMTADPLLWVVLTLREDYIAALEPYAYLLTDKLRARFYMQRMNYEAALEAIEQPARLGGRPFAPGIAQMLVDNLRQLRLQPQLLPTADTISAADSGGQPPALSLSNGSAVGGPGLGQYIEPVQLQVVCYQLWQNLTEKDPKGLGKPLGSGLEITAADLAMLGNVDTALSEFYEQTLRAVGAEVSELALRRWFNDELITEAGTRGIVFRGLHETAGLPNAVVKRLADLYLLRAEMRAGGTWYELVHDRFVEPIQQANQKWEAERLQRNPLAAPAAAWQNDPTKLLDGLQLRTAAEYAEANPQDMTEEEQEFLQESQRQETEREKKAKITAQRRHIYTGITVVIIAVLAGLTIWALQKQTEAEHQTRQARLALAHQLNTQAETVLEEKPELALLLSIEAVQQTEPPREIALERTLRETLASFTGFSLVGHTAQIYDLAISSHGHWAATSGYDRTTRLWDLTATFPTTASTILWGHSGAIEGVSFSPDERWLATGSKDGTVRLWDMTTPNPAATSTRLLGPAAAVTKLAFSPNNHWLVAGSKDGLIHLWNMTAPSQARAATVLSGHDNAEFGVTALAISPDSHWLVTGGSDGTLLRWDLTMPDVTAYRIPLPGHDNLINALAISPDSHWLVTGAAMGEKGGVSYRYDLTNPAAPPFSLTDDTFNVQAVAISSDPDKVWVAISGDDSTVRLRSLSDTDIAPIVLSHPQKVNQIIISPDNHWLITGSDDGKIRLWDMTQPELITSTPPLALSAYDTPITTMSLSQNRWLIVASNQSVIPRLWDLAAPKTPAFEPVILPKPDRPVNALTVSSNNRWLISAEWFKHIRLWDLNQAWIVTSTQLITTPGEMIDAIVISPDNRWLIAGANSGIVYRWDLTRPDTPPHHWPAHTQAVASMAITPDKKWLVTVGHDALVRLWDLESAIAGPTLSSDNQAVNAVVVTPDNHWLISGGDDQAIHRWNLNNLTQPAKVFTTSGRILSLAVSPDNRWLAAGSDGDAIRVWNLANLDAAPTYLSCRAPCLGINALAVSPDSRWLLTGANDAIVRLWNLTDLKANPLILTGHQSGIRAVAISPDNRRLISTGEGEGESIRLWTLPLAELLEKACRAAGRNLTDEEWNRYFPERPYRQTCGQFGVHDSVYHSLFGEIEQISEDKEAIYKAKVAWAVTTTDTGLNKGLCRWGSLDGFARIVLPSCERALALGPVTGWLYTSQGINWAMQGHYDQAIAQFKAALEWFRQHNLYETYAPPIETWLAELTAHRNPFADPVVRQTLLLKDDP